jgi:hypothetical protein
MSVHAERIPVRRAHQVRRLAAIHASPLDIVGYWLALGASYLVLLSLWWYAAEEKIIAGNLNVPVGITRQFAGSFIASVPGTKAAWVILAVLEALTFVGVFISLLSGEFLPHRPKSWLLGSAIFSLVPFALMIFGDSMTAQHASVASLYTYFAATILVIGLVRMMPPYRSDRWLSGEIVHDGDSPQSR